MPNEWACITAHHACNGLKDSSLAANDSLLFVHIPFHNSSLVISSVHIDINSLNLEDDAPRQNSEPDMERHPMNLAATEQLCSRCQNIDFDTILFGERAAPKWEGQALDVESLGSVQDWDLDSCVLCKALFNLIPVEDRSEPSKKYTLSSFPSENSPWIQYYFPLLGNLPPRIVLRMGDHLLVPQLEEDDFVRPLDANSVDCEVLRGWLSLCSKMHTTNCSSKNRTTVNYLKLLDCETRKLVPAGSLPYVTLSYMWGANELPPQYTEQLGQDLPPTIEDSIVVTLKLGHRYLWIDRYCINQQNKEQAMSQIQQMDSIYKDSEVTIVAAAGIGPGYGLPGVSRPRRPQAFAQIGKLQLISPGSTARQVLKDARWSTRGWTFQEAYLSRRRLTFTDEQVYYECSGVYSYESLNISLENMHNEDGQTLAPRFFNNLDGKIVVFPGGVGYEPLHIFDRIIDFSVKSLTYTSDKLNGFLGIAKAFETGPHRVRHLWGSPILPKPAGQSTPKDYHVTELLSAMVWLYGDAERVPSLPSWSWVGWDGDLFFSFMGNFHPLNQTPPTTVSIELLSGEIMPWDTFHEQYQDINSLTNISQYIHISTHTIPITIPSRRGLSCRTNVYFRDGCYLSWKFDQHDSRFTSESCIGALLVDNRDPNLDRMVFMLIVAEVDGKMERVGGSWLPLDSILYDASGEPVFGKGKKHGEQYVKYEQLVERYGEWWHGELVSSYKTVRLG